MGSEQDRFEPAAASDNLEQHAPDVIQSADDLDDDEHTFTVDEPEPEPQNQLPSPMSQKGTMHNTSPQLSLPERPQGVKRKSTSDERTVDPEATTALIISDLHWWTTEDEIRSWTNQVNAELDLKELSFSEHKVNGKSKGQVYLLFRSAGASTAVKHKVETLTDGTSQNRKFSVSFSNPSSNPFKTLPKDAPARSKEERSSRGAYNNTGHSKGDYLDRGSFRGRGRGGYDRGGGNRNFSGPSTNGGFNSNNNIYGNNMNAGSNFAFTGRGGMVAGNMRAGTMNMRGGRGAAMNSAMMMGSMGMPAMGMNPMMAGMGMQGFQGHQFGAPMYQQAGFGGEWAQPGAKRQRLD
ncbi:uncharacterized protein AB675_8569 [Cyphellophora attinorum]|uniref:RRM domain-containing protein n=1 Tax=Cyphellophora attinorum TaxID=1664694 RepID=A0A0N0NR38_9EURO|nr:uncharacterized protein AB675_8569 [Phialophora attinorum]KPI44638.1 hypothetical protein AB675_8569 [Phialophora attinorum]